MDKLAKAVERGIISQAQCDQIRALGPDDIPNGAETDFRFSLVHILWVAGVALVVVALVILAVQIVDDENTLLVVSLIYAAGLLALDQVIKGRADMRLLSSCLYFGVAICGVFAIIALQEIWGTPEYFQIWPRDADSGAELLSPLQKLGVFLFFSLAPVAILTGLIGFGLLRIRKFLPAWLLAVPAAFLLALEVLNLITRGGLDVLDFLDEVALIAAFVLAASAWRFDLRSPHNHGFWLNKFALLFFGAWLSFQYFEESRQNMVLVLAILLIFLAIYWRRPFGVPVGACFIVTYIAELFDWWEDPLVVAAFLAVIGGVLIFWGVRARLIENRLEALLPERLRALRPARRDDPVTFGL